MTMKNIESLTSAYAAERAILIERVQEYEDQVQQLKRKLLPGIKRAVSTSVAAQLRLQAVVDENRDLFVKPKSVIISGIRVGLQKQPGKIEWDDAEKVVALIRKHLPDQAEILVKVEETPVKKALAQLTGAELKKLGVRVGEDADAILIKAVDGDVDKLVDALIKDETSESVKAAA